MSNYPTVRPSLTLDFQKSKQLDPRISFSRASTATYVEGGVVKTADEHQARFEDEGLLVEESRTNVYKDNHLLLNVTDNGTASATTGPDGNPSSATRITATAAGFVQAINASNRNIVWSNSVKTTWSFYFKPSNTTAEIVGVGVVSGAGQGGADFNYVTLTTTLTGSSAKPREAADIIPVGNGWFRCWVRYNDTLSPTGGYRMSFKFTAGAASEYIDVCFAQVEEGEFLTSYIPTSGSTVTRAADVAQLTGDNFSSWYNNSEGTMLADVGPSLRPGDAVYLGTNNNRVMVSGTINLNLQVNGTNANTNIQHTNVVDGNSIKFAYAIKPGDYAFAVRGSNLTGSNNTINSVNQMTIGRNIAFGGTNRLNGCVARLSYYPERLTNEQLEAITS